MIEKLEIIKNHPTMKDILKDSFWWVLYDLANVWKYDSDEILNLWNELNNSEKESADWIIKGAISFLKNKS